MLLPFQLQQLSLFERFVYIRENGQFLKGAVVHDKKTTSYLMDNYIATVIIKTTHHLLEIEEIIINESFSQN